jgi:hypothetical protein
MVAYRDVPLSSLLTIWQERINPDKNRLLRSKCMRRE